MGVSDHGARGWESQVASESTHDGDFEPAGDQAVARRGEVLGEIGLLEGDRGAVFLGGL